ncbi:SUN domain-containing protein 2 [Phytophthora cinnamomi]|uniref:SUN domain-containing protein 2 n=1 Tax=Phytophthora cinnamomi TaxID=4785 RepID=UPI00355AB5DA|nr:SUN domain-containing protein 2 [Phytophthora cinnamomi]
MAEGNAYSLRSRRGRRSASTSSEDSEDLEPVTRRSTRRYGDYTPEPVQRTLELRSGDLDDDDDDDEDSDFEELDDYRGTVYRSTTYRPPQVDGEDVNEPESVHEEEEEDVDELESPRPEVRRSELKRRAAGAAAYFTQPQSAGGLWQNVTSSKIVKTTLKLLRRLWRFVLRNSFMAVNVLWLLAPLCCFVIAITVPQYLTSAIQYVDVLSSKVIGSRGSADAGLEKGAMRSLVQEIVDMKMVGMNEEIGLLRQTVQTQERELEAMKLLHDTLRHAHDEAQQKFSLAEPGSAITVHIEKIVAKHTDELWEKFMDTTARLQQDVRTATKQQSVLSSAVKEQEEKMDSVQSIVKKTVEATNDSADDQARERDMRKEFIAWRDTFERDLQFEMKSKVQDIEDRMSKVLQEEKQALSSSADALRGLDATDPGILRVIEVAVQAVEIKKTGRVDHAALANGASVIHSERDLLYQDNSSPVQLLTQLLGLNDPADDGKFTSPSFRRAPAPFLGQLLSSGEIPWWLSRHNGRPETALSETMEMGSCWGIAGSSGRLSVKFAQQIVADAITIDHIPAQIASDFSSAPNEFRILGISGHPLRETVELIPFGNFSYASTGSASQTFKLTSPLSQRSAIDGITLEVLSNHGNPEYTCLYRFRVHGQPA